MIAQEDIKYNDRFGDTRDWDEQDEYKELPIYEIKNGVISDCCGAEIIEGSQVCMACKEHCGEEIESKWCLRHQHSYKGKICDFCEHN